MQWLKSLLKLNHSLKGKHSGVAAMRPGRPEADQLKAQSDNNFFNSIAKNKF